MNNIETKEIRVNVTELKAGDVLIGSLNRVVNVWPLPATGKVSVSMVSPSYPRSRFTQIYKVTAFLTIERGILA